MHIWHPLPPPPDLSCRRRPDRDRRKAVKTDGRIGKQKPFDYPINLMFSGSMPVFEGDFESALNQMIAALKAEA